MRPEWNHREFCRLHFQMKFLVQKPLYMYFHTITLQLVALVLLSKHRFNIGPEWHLFTAVAASYRGETRGLWINASPRQRSLVKFHLSEFGIWKGFSPWGNRGSVACHLLRMKTSATYPQPQVASQHLDGTWTRRPSPLPTAMLVWYGEQPRGITPLAESRGRTQDLLRGKPVTCH